MRNFDNSELSVRALNVLRHLNIYNANDLSKAILPKIGTLLYSNNLLHIEVYYTARIDKEIKDFLNDNK